MLLEGMVKAANQLFAILWTVVVVLLPFVLILCWII